MYGGRHAGVLFTPPGPLVSALSYTLAKWGVQPIFYRYSTPAPAMMRGCGVNGDGLTPTEQRCHKAWESGLIRRAQRKGRARDELRSVGQLGTCRLHSLNE